MLRLISNLILTRLLVPDMFGIMAVANMLIWGLHIITDIGLGQNLIQSKRGNDPDYVNTIWTVQIFKGAVIFLMGMLLSLGMYILNLFHFWSSSAVYAEPVLPLIVAVCSINALIAGFASTKVATASRNLSIGKNTLLDFISQVIGIIVMVIWAYIDRSVWALVAGSIVSSIIGVYTSHRFLSGLPNRFHWDYKIFQEIFHFGKWIFLTSILGFFAGSGDRLVLGGLIDANNLGLYAIAFILANAVQDILHKLGSSIGFPAFSEVHRDRPEQLKEVYYKLRRMLDIFALMATGFLFVAGHLIVEFLYDDRYILAGHMLEILSVGLIAARYGLAEQCYMAIGKPNYNAPLIGLRMVAMFALVPIAHHFFGMEGALWAIAANSFVSLPIVIYFKVKNNLFDLKKEIMVLPSIFVGAFLGYITIQCVVFFKG